MPPRHHVRVGRSDIVCRRLRETSKELIAKREAAELEVYIDLVRDHANSIAAIKQVIGATEQQVAAGQLRKPPDARDAVGTTPRGGQRAPPEPRQP